MSSKTPEKIKPKFILERIEELKGAGVSEDLVNAIKCLADRCVPRDAVGGGWNAKGNKLRYKCPTCGVVIKGLQFNTCNAEDNICPNCKQHINWFGDEDDEFERTGDEL